MTYRFNPVNFDKFYSQAISDNLYKLIKQNNIGKKLFLYDCKLSYMTLYLISTCPVSTRILDEYESFDKTELDDFSTQEIGGYIISTPIKGLPFRIVILKSHADILEKIQAVMRIELSEAVKITNEELELDLNKEKVGL